VNACNCFTPNSQSNTTKPFHLDVLLRCDNQQNFNQIQDYQLFALLIKTNSNTIWSTAGLRFSVLAYEFLAAPMPPEITS